MYMYIYIYAVVLLSGPSLAFWGVIIWAKLAFHKTLFVKNTINIGVSALFLKKTLRAQIWGVIIWAKLAIFKLQKKPFCCNPLFTKHFCFFFKLGFLKPKTLMLNKKHNLKSGKSKDKKKEFERKNKTWNPKKRKYWWSKLLQLNILMLFLSWNRNKEERKGKNETKTRKQKKQKRKTRRKKKGQEQERDREREIEKGGGQKRLRRKEGRHSNIDKTCPFQGEKNKLFCIKKQRKERKKQSQKKK